MEIIIYQGQDIQAQVVNYLSGNIPTSTVDHDGDEDLLRDERGRYYLRRTLNLLDSEGEEPRPASGRTLVHRLNVNAAILWATTRLNSQTLDLRCDAAKLLMENRGYVDPHPAHLTPPQRAAFGSAGAVHDDDEDHADQEIEHGPIQATVDKPATASAIGLRYHVDLAAEEAATVRAVAQRCGLPVLAFIAQYLDGTLPGQLARLHKDRPADLRPSDIVFTCADAAILSRIERAATFLGKSVEAFVADTLAAQVLSTEDDMLLHPTTGELAGDRMELGDLPGFDCPKVVMPPLSPAARQCFDAHPGLDAVLQRTNVRGAQAADADAKA